ncbi:MAG: BRCT domain-containing protein [Proteobacteria bacterium]|nr:BRCT domain-containing protein [Pseudomonadota bacterium]
MTHFVYDIYSGFIEDTLSVVGSRDTTLVERYQRLGNFSQGVLGLPSFLMRGWEEAIEMLIMTPPKQLTTLSQAVAMLMIMRDAGQRRFRIITDTWREDFFLPHFQHLGHSEYARDFLGSAIAGLLSPDKAVRWGFLDINQIKALLQGAFGNDSFTQTKTAVIAGRLSHMPRAEAEHALIDVGIDTQNSISHNVDYLIVGSKGTGGTKHEKAQNLNDAGRQITVLDENGFDALLRSPKPPPENWPPSEKEIFEDIVSALRHVWAFGLDLYCLSFAYDPDENTL